MEKQIQQKLPIKIDNPFEIFPHKFRLSGTYRLRKRPNVYPFRLPKGELRLDIDGWYPQMTVSVTLSKSFIKPSHFIASIEPSAKQHEYQGEIWYTNFARYLGKEIKLKIHIGHIRLKPSIELSFSGMTEPLVFDYYTDTFHPLKLEYDYASDAALFTSFDTSTHPNKPGTLPEEELTIAKVYKRAGFAVSETGNNNAIPIADAGADQRWTEGEMHDAMETHFSQYSDNPRWAAWAFFASLSNRGSSLGGIMFDSEDAPTRQGCAVFVDSFLASKPVNDPDADAYVQRMKFWCACHELGHCLNLAHPWQKELEGPFGNPWTDIKDNVSSLSLMNYPFKYPEGSKAYFENHEYRFDDMELIFLRHAPKQFVQPGNVEWFHNHGFEEDTTTPSKYELSIKTNRQHATYEFLECIVLELKLKNISESYQAIDSKILARGNTTIIIEKQNGTAKKYRPYSKLLYQNIPVILNRGESLYESVFVSAGVNGFDLSEPGDYKIHCALQIEGANIISQPLSIRILPPSNYEEERIAQDFFSHSVGRVLAFDGSHFHTKGIDFLREVSERLPERKVAQHAKVALGMNLATDKKILTFSDRNEKKIKVVKANLKESKEFLESALIGDYNETRSTLSNIDYNDYMHSYIDLLEKTKDAKRKSKALNLLQSCLKSINAPQSVQELAKR